MRCSTSSIWRCRSRRPGLSQRAIGAGELRHDVDIDAMLDWLPGLLVLRAICRTSVPPVEDAERLVDTVLNGAAPR